MDLLSLLGGIRRWVPVKNLLKKPQQTETSRLSLRIRHHEQSIREMSTRRDQKPDFSYSLISLSGFQAIIYEFSSTFLSQQKEDLLFADIVAIPPPLVAIIDIGEGPKNYYK